MAHLILFFAPGPMILLNSIAMQQPLIEAISLQSSFFVTQRMLSYLYVIFIFIDFANTIQGKKFSSAHYIDSTRILKS